MIGTSSFYQGLALLLVVCAVPTVAAADCLVGDLKGCPEGSYCGAVYQDGVCPKRGFCMKTLPAPARIEFSLPVPAGVKVYCSKGMLHPGRSTHNACDPSTRFSIDLSGTAGERPHFVLATAAGRVRVLGGCATRDLNRQAVPDVCNLGFGNAVRISHGPHLYSQVAHLSSILVRDGAQVERGDVLGIEGNTGNAGSKHIHWSLHLGSIEASVPGPTVPIPRIRLRRGGRTTVISAIDLRCGNAEISAEPQANTLVESENRLGRRPPHRFGFRTKLDEVVDMVTSNDPTKRSSGIRWLRRRYDQPESPYLIGLAYLMAGDTKTARSEIHRSLRRAVEGKGPTWLKGLCHRLLERIARGDGKKRLNTSDFVPVLPMTGASGP